MKNRRPTYVVTRIVTGDLHGTCVPNLGVHRSAKDADAHFFETLKNRLEIPGAKQHWCFGPMDHGDVRSSHPGRRRKALVSWPGMMEELRIEVWR